MKKTILTEKQIDYFNKKLNIVDYNAFSEFIPEFNKIDKEIESLIMRIFKNEFLDLIQESESEIFLKLLFLKMFLLKKLIKIDLIYEAFLKKYDKYIIDYLSEYEIEFIRRIHSGIKQQIIDIK